MPTGPALAPIIAAADLVAADGDVVVCEVGTPMVGSDPIVDFESGHLPGARYVSLDDDLSGRPGPIVGGHPLPSPAAFAETLGRLGIGTGTSVVAYDRQTGGFAARLVWMLRVIGQSAALLDGGIDAWIEPLEVGPAAPTDPVATPERAWPDGAFVEAADVDAARSSGGIVIDSRAAIRYTGEHEPLHPMAGHVPGAVNLPFADNLVDGRFRSATELRARFEPVLGDGDGEAIVYCGSGVTACHNALAIEYAGLGRARVYVGSWSGWSSDPGRGVATGPTP